MLYLLEARHSAMMSGFFIPFQKRMHTAPHMPSGVIPFFEAATLCRYNFVSVLTCCYEFRSSPTHAKSIYYPNNCIAFGFTSSSRSSLEKLLWELGNCAMLASFSQVPLRRQS